MRVKEESEKAVLKLNIKIAKIIASSSITSWQIDGKKMKTVAYFIFFGSQISMESTCSLEIKSHLLLERKAVTKVDYVLIKQRHYFANNGPYSQSVVFLVVMYR